MIVEKRLNLLFDTHVRHHLSGNLAESGHAIGDLNKPALVDSGDVARDIPAVAKYLGGLFGIAEIAEHPVRTLHEQQALPIEQRSFTGIGVDNHGRHAWQRMAHRSDPRAALALTAV